MDFTLALVRVLLRIPGFLRTVWPLVALVAIIAWWTGDIGKLLVGDRSDLKFLSDTNLRNVVNQQAIIGVAALGAALVVFSGGIDLSVGSVVALAGLTVALVFDGAFATQVEKYFLLPWMPAAIAGLLALVACWFLHSYVDKDLKPVRSAAWAIVCIAGGIALLGEGGRSAALAGAFVGLMCGYVNGLLVGATKIVPFIVTLGAMEIWRGATEQLAGQTKVNLADRAKLDDYLWLKNLTAAQPEPAWLVVAPSVWLFLGSAVVLVVMLRVTKLGRYIYAVGSNEEACRLSGVPVTSVKLWVYSLAGLLAGLAGVLQFARLKSGDPSAGRGFELEAIAAVVIGGGSLRGGEGSILGVVVGVLLMGVLRNGCNLANVPNSMERIVVGAIIVAAVALDEWRRRSRLA